MEARDGKEEAALTSKKKGGRNKSGEKRSQVGIFSQTCAHPEENRPQAQGAALREGLERRPASCTLPAQLSHN